MVDTANVVEIKSVVTQLINPHRAHLARESTEELSWEWLLKQLGVGDKSQRLIQWVCAHPMYLIEVQNDTFKKRPVVLSELLRRENLNRDDFVRHWIQTDSSPRFSLLQQLEHQRHTLQIAGMMWFNPVLSVAYDYQELFQSFCEFLRVVGALIDATHDLMPASEGVIQAVSNTLWGMPIEIQCLPRACAESSESPILSELFQSRCFFERLIKRAIKLHASVLATDSHLRERLSDKTVASAHWLKVMHRECRYALERWLSPISREDTRLGAQPIQEIYADLSTYLSYCLMNAGLREGLSL